MTAHPDLGAAVAPMPPCRRRHPVLATAAWCAGLMLVAQVLWVLGRGPLAPLPLSGWTEIDRWLEDRTPVAAAFALLRIAALAVVVYLLVLTVVALCAHVLRLPGLLRAVEVSSIPAVRRVLTTVAGVSLGASATLVAVTPGVGVPVRPAAATAGPAAPRVSLRPDRVVIEQVRLAPMVFEEVAPTRPAPATVAPMTGAPSTAPASVTAPAPAPTWTVRPGDHLWSIARAHLGSVRGRPATNAETDPYWRALVDANRPALPDPTNPDLIFAGMVLTLPPIPAGPRATAAAPATGATSAAGSTTAAPTVGATERAPTADPAHRSAGTSPSATNDVEPAPTPTPRPPRPRSEGRDRSDPPTVRADARNVPVPADRTPTIRRESATTSSADDEPPIVGPEPSHRTTDDTPPTVQPEQGDDSPPNAPPAVRRSSADHVPPVVIEEVGPE